MTPNRYVTARGKHTNSDSAIKSTWVSLGGTGRAAGVLSRFLVRENFLRKSPQTSEGGGLEYTGNAVQPNPLLPLHISYHNINFVPFIIYL